MILDAGFFFEQSFILIREWLSKCSSSHDKCPSQSEQHYLPTRVIRVGSEEEEPRLVVPGRILGQWAALSHCWGSSKQTQPPTTTTKSLALHCQKLKFSKLPRSFRDAIIITRKLGLKYLWIDSLCILQDSSADWTVEARNMGMVYKNAFVTIAAEGGRDATYGILGGPKGTWKTWAKCHSNARNLRGEIFLKPSITFKYDYRGPLSQRAWTLQEDILSSRVLRFTRDFVYWRCAEPDAYSTRQEGWVSSLGPLEILVALDGSPLGSLFSVKDEHLPSYIAPTSLMTLQYWYQFVLPTYTRRRLTYGTDKMIAVSGIARELQRYLRNSKYEAGIWSNDYHKGLLWPSPRCKKCLVKRYEEYIAPSWSWGCLKVDSKSTSTYPSQVDWDINRYDLEAISNILKISVKNKDDDQFGIILGANLTLEAEVYQTCSCRIPDGFLDIQSEHSSGIRH